jgi:tetratricopeptide (TPR) repeat protein
MLINIGKTDYGWQRLRPEMERLRFSRIVILALLFFVAPVMAQQDGQDGSTDPTTPSTPTPDTPKPPPVVSPEPSYQEIPQRPIAPPPPSNLFISGMVVTEDGSPPPFGATIEMECGSSLTRQASVGGNGYFSFQVGGSKNYGLVMPDASTGYGRDPYHTDPLVISSQDGNDGYYSRITVEALATKMVGCDLRAQLPGYRSTIVRVKEVLQPGHNDLGTIVVYPIERVQGTTVSVTGLLAPKDVKKSLERAKKAVEKKKLKEAEAHLKSAVQAYPEYGEAWFELGQLYKQQYRDEEARNAYMRAIETDELYVRPYIGLSWLSSIEQNWQEAAAFTGRAIHLDPITFPEVYFLNALANLNLGKIDIAEKSARQYQRLDPWYRFPMVFLILSNVCAMRDDDAGSIEEMHNYLKYAPDAADAEEIRSILKEKLAKAADVR